MVFNHFEWKRDSGYPKIHPTQKPVNLLKELISIFTDEGDVVIDPVAGSATTLRAAYELRRNSYGFEIKKDFFKKANEEMLDPVKNQISLFDYIDDIKREDKIRKFKKSSQVATSI